MSDSHISSDNIDKVNITHSHSQTTFISILWLYLLPIYNLIKSFLNIPIIIENTNDNDENNKKKIINSSSLFPSVKLFNKLSSKDLKECSTNFNSQLISFTNNNGELEFQLIEREKTNSNSKLQLSPVSDTTTSSSPPIKNDLKLSSTTTTTTANDFLALSPVSSIKSTTTSNDEEDDSIDDSDSNSINSSDESDDLLNNNGGKKIHECTQCNSKFRIRGYLTRHMKKHSKEKAYRCPFYDSNSHQKCHATGGFSRRDTYKTHLKARHFKYPPGIKSSDRIGMNGWCSICGEKFINNEIWVERHIELGLCPGLPESHLKTLKIGKKKTGKHSKLLDVTINNKKDTARSPLSLNSSPSPKLVYGQQPQPQQQQYVDQQQQNQLQLQLQLQLAQQAAMFQQQQFLLQQQVQLQQQQQQQQVSVQAPIPMSMPAQLQVPMQVQAPVSIPVHPDVDYSQEEEDEFFESLDSENSPFTYITRDDPVQLNNTPQQQQQQGDKINYTQDQNGLIYYGYPNSINSNTLINNNLGYNGVGNNPGFNLGNLQQQEQQYHTVV
ncbi:hypothetical protein CANARDRAFT_7350 [[Candida] arabinofermentans NRRL YB-2248]|uniref:C2H2-type domain-containing protein n=1 Tax=[Candida] arabinofermentans NRRL YB-2248 TaxID=983967 RepID=A0A1E4T2M1_9ASCO|nr:hypothetical protein CANARDRAFT_7350 [[Candida] arabinofermentans NRRL YB-2248]